MPECAVVGSPIAHSRSPVLHRAAYAALGLTDWSYKRVELHAGELRSWLAGLGDNWRGVSVTMPLKQEAVTGADTASDLAADLRAANTLIRGVGGWHADNTDVAGLSGAIRELGAGDARSHSSGSVRGSATVIGAGGRLRRLSPRSPISASSTWTSCSGTQLAVGSWSRWPSGLA